MSPEKAGVEITSGDPRSGQAITWKLSAASQAPIPRGVVLSFLGKEADVLGERTSGSSQHPGREWAQSFEIPLARVAGGAELQDRMGLREPELGVRVAAVLDNSEMFGLSSSSTRESALAGVVDRRSMLLMGHGWDGTRFSFNPEDLMRHARQGARTGKNIFVMVPTFMGHESGRRKELGCSTRDSYAEEIIAVLEDLGVLNSESPRVEAETNHSSGPVYLVFHSFGGSALVDFANKVSACERYRDTEGNLPDIRLLLLAPGSPWESCIFAGPKFWAPLFFLNLVPEKARKWPPFFNLASIISRRLVKTVLTQTNPRQIGVYAETAVLRPWEALTEMGYLVGSQPDFTLEEWSVFNNPGDWPVRVILTSPKDDVVSELLSHRFFDRLTAALMQRVAAGGGDADRVLANHPLCFTEKNVSPAEVDGSDHHLQGARHTNMEVLCTYQQIWGSATLVALIQVLSPIPKDKLAQAMRKMDHDMAAIRAIKGRKRDQARERNEVRDVCFRQWALFSFPDEIGQDILTSDEDVYTYVRRNIVDEERATQVICALQFYRDILSVGYKLQRLPEIGDDMDMNPSWWTRFGWWLGEKWRRTLIYKGYKSIESRVRPKKVEKSPIV